MPPPPKDPELLALERRARALGTRIQAPNHAYPPFGERRDAGYPNVLRRDGAWVWEVHERGRLLERRASEDEDDVLYWIFASVAREMGSRWELDHRVPDPGSRIDTRIGWAGRTLELLEALDPRWAARFRREEDSWLRTVALPATPPAPFEAAAAIPLRDGPGGLEVLMARRSLRTRFLPGFWVFPGGRVDPADAPRTERWRAAAAREAAEEVGVVLDPASLVPFDRWITPEGSPRRFDSAFYLARAPASAEPVVDGREMLEARWATPARFLADADAGTPITTYPTQAQLRRLASFAGVAEALASCGDVLPPATITTVEDVDGRPAMVVAGPDGVPRRFREGPVRDDELPPGRGV
jgi:8-oxo-dGTP pyrophosphatase MutT (NUDIX family)